MHYISNILLGDINIKSNNIKGSKENTNNDFDPNDISGMTINGQTFNIKNITGYSKEIMKLLKRDNIELSEIDNYHLYPIADNDTPKLSADRLEYSLSNALFTYRLLDLASIKEIYDDIEIQTNEEKEIDVHKIKISPKYIIVGPNMDNYYSYSNNDGEEYMRKLFPEFKQVEEDC